MSTEQVYEGFFRGSDALKGNILAGVEKSNMDESNRDCIKDIIEYYSNALVKTVRSSYKEVHGKEFERIK